MDWVGETEGGEIAKATLSSIEDQGSREKISGAKRAKRAAEELKRTRGFHFCLVLAVPFESGVLIGRHSSGCQLCKSTCSRIMIPSQNGEKDQCCLCQRESAYE